MRQLLCIAAAIAAHTLCDITAQPVLPAPASEAVTVHPDTAVLLHPADFWTANAAALAAVIEGEDIDVDWSQLTGTPTTLGGYGITDAQPLNNNLTSLAGLTGASGSFLRWTGANTLDVRTATQTRADIGANNADNLTTGTLADARLSGNVPLLDGENQVWMEHNTFESLSVVEGVLSLQELVSFRLAAVASPNYVEITRPSSYASVWNLLIPDESARGSATIATREWVSQRPDAANPVFVIQNWGQWTDLEIKGLAPGNEKIYYYHSPDPEKTTITGQVWDDQPRLWYTDTSTGGTNIRRWHMQNATQSIAAQLGDPANGYVGGWVIMIRGLDMTREELQQVSWSYALFDGASREEDALGRQIWRPIVPTDFQPDDYDPDD